MGGMRLWITKWTFKHYWWKILMKRWKKKPNLYYFVTISWHSYWLTKLVALIVVCFGPTCISVILRIIAHVLLRNMKWSSVNYNTAIYFIYFHMTSMNTSVTHNERDECFQLYCKQIGQYYDPYCWWSKLSKLRPWLGESCSCKESLFKGQFYDPQPHLKKKKCCFVMNQTNNHTHTTNKWTKRK